MFSVMWFYYLGSLSVSLFYMSVFVIVFLLLSDSLSCSRFCGLAVWCIHLCSFYSRLLLLGKAYNPAVNDTSLIKIPHFIF